MSCLYYVGRNITAVIKNIPFRLFLYISRKKEVSIAVGIFHRHRIIVKVLVILNGRKNLKLTPSESKAFAYLGENNGYILFVDCFKHFYIGARRRYHIFRHIRHNNRAYFVTVDYLPHIPYMVGMRM